MPVIKAMTGRRGLRYLANENYSQDQMKKALFHILFFCRTDDGR